MQQFQNFSYQQPNQFQSNFNQSMQNPYMDRMAQLQQYQQNLQPQIQQPQFIAGKVVNDFSEITAMDVPQNGQAAFFPKSDGSEIQARARASNGLIQTVSYKPVLEQNQEDGTNIPQMDFNALNEDVKALREDIKGVREMIEKSMNVPATKTTSSRTKKGADEE